MGAGYVGLGEVLSLEQQGLPRRLRKSVGKAVPIIETSGVPALTEIDERLPCNVRLFFSHWLNRDACPAHECVELAAAIALGLGLHIDRCLDERCRRYAA